MLRAGRKSRSVNRPHFNWIFCQRCLSSRYTIYRTKMATSSESRDTISDEREVNWREKRLIATSATT